MKYLSGFLTLVKIFWAGLMEKINGPTVDKTKDQEAAILVKERDSQITTTNQADSFWNAH